MLAAAQHGFQLTRSAALRAQLKLALGAQTQTSATSAGERPIRGESEERVGAL